MVKKSAAELQYLRFRTVVEAVSSVLHNLIRWGGAVVIVYYGYKTVQALAGQATMADIGIKVLGDIRISNAVAWLFGGGGIAYGWRQNRLRRDTVERLSGRIQSLERGIDPKRTSSKLTRRGDTHPEDQP